MNRIVLSLLAGLVCHFAIAETPTKPEYLELAPFKVKQGVKDENVLKMIDQMEGSIRNFPGFIRRDTLKMTDGTWLDIVRWKDKASADAAAPLAIKSEACQAFFAILDENSPPMQYGEQVRIQSN